MTNEELVNSLKICSNDDDISCIGCIYANVENKCIADLCKEAVKLIDVQDAALRIANHSYSVLKEWMAKQLLMENVE